MIRLERTADNADLFTARRIEAARKYRIELRVDPADQGQSIYRSGYCSFWILIKYCSYLLLLSLIYWLR